MSNDLQVMTFSAQLNNSPQKLNYNKNDVASALPVHSCITGKYDSVYLFLHSVSATEIPVFVYQSEYPHTHKTLFKFIKVLPKGNHQNLMFNGHTMFQNQNLYLVVGDVAQEGKVFCTGYVKRFTI
jgi:hypothetical protein